MRILKNGADINEAAVHNVEAVRQTFADICANVGRLAAAGQTVPVTADDWAEAPDRDFGSYQEWVSPETVEGSDMPVMKVRQNDAGTPGAEWSVEIAGQPMDDGTPTTACFAMYEAEGPRVAYALIAANGGRSGFYGGVIEQGTVFNASRLTVESQRFEQLNSAVAAAAIA